MGQWETHKINNRLTFISERCPRDRPQHGDAPRLHRRQDGSASRLEGSSLHRPRRRDGLRTDGVRQVVHLQRGGLHCLLQHRQPVLSQGFVNDLNRQKKILFELATFILFVSSNWPPFVRSTLNLYSTLKDYIFC